MLTREQFLERYSDRISQHTQFQKNQNQAWRNSWSRQNVEEAFISMRDDLDPTGRRTPIDLRTDLTLFLDDQANIDWLKDKIDEEGLKQPAPTKPPPPVPFNPKIHAAVNKPPSSPSIPVASKASLQSKKPGILSSLKRYLTRTSGEKEIDKLNKKMVHILKKELKNAFNSLKRSDILSSENAEVKPLLEAIKRQCTFFEKELSKSPVSKYIQKMMEEYDPLKGEKQSTYLFDKITKNLPKDAKTLSHLNQIAPDIKGHLYRSVHPDKPSESASRPKRS